MILNKNIFFLIIISFVFSGCVEYDALPFDGKTLVRRTQYGNDWLYYNLKDDYFLNPTISGDSILENKDGIAEGRQKDRKDWDIAFNRYNIRTNSGLSGNGKSGVYDMGLIAYDDVHSVSQLPADISFTIDDEYNITMSEQMWNEKYFPIDRIPWFDPNTGPKQMKSSANSLLGNALRFSGPPPEYTPSNHIYIIRSADGNNYYKLLIISWYDQYKIIGERGGKISFKCDKLKN